MTSRPDAAEEQWKRLMSGEQPSEVASVPAYRQTQTPHEAKADERTRLVREMTDDATSRRVANVARLRAARLDQETHKALDTPAAPTPTSRPPR